MLGITEFSTQEEVDAIIDSLEFEFDDLGEESEFRYIAYCVSPGMEDWYAMSDDLDDAFFTCMKEIEQAAYIEMGLDNVCVSQ